MIPASQASTLVLIKELALRLNNLMQDEFLSSRPHSEPDHDVFGKTPLSGNFLTISSGWPGLLLLFSELDRSFPEEGWDQSSHFCVLRIEEALERFELTDLSMLQGITGISFALEQGSKNLTKSGKKKTNKN